MAVRPDPELPHEDAVEDREMVDRRGGARVSRRFAWRRALLVFSLQTLLLSALLWPRGDPIGPRAMGWVVENAWGWYVGVCIAFGLGGVLLLGAVYGRKR